MSKLNLDSVTNIDAITTINANFDRIEQELQNKVLYRDNPVGEPNTLQTDMDVNGKKIYNVGSIEIGDELFAPITVVEGLVEDAEASATASNVSAGNAATSATNAATSATNASNSATAASGSAASALASKIAAEAAAGSVTVTTGANTFTGPQTLPGNATDPLHAVPKQQLPRGVFAKKSAGQAGGSSVTWNVMDRMDMTMTSASIITSPSGLFGYIDANIQLYRTNSGSVTTTLTLWVNNVQVASTGVLTITNAARVTGLLKYTGVISGDIEVRSSTSFGFGTLQVYDVNPAGSVPSSIAIMAIS